MRIASLLYEYVFYMNIENSGKTLYNIRNQREK